MQNLISQLMRLYLPQDAVTPDALERHLIGAQTLELTLVDGCGLTRALYLPFARLKGDQEDAHWQRLCLLANALQQDLDLPAPAVSIDGAHAFGLWLSFATPIPAEQAQQFGERLVATYLPDYPLASLSLALSRQLPPSLNPASGKWAAFIHPGMGAAFMDDAGLDFAPPPSAQLAFLEPLAAITVEQLESAMAQLGHAVTRAVTHAVTHAITPEAAPSAPAVRAPTTPSGLLLKDATLEDIVRHLHAMHIEPTFRYLLPEKK